MPPDNTDEHFDRILKEIDDVIVLYQNDKSDAAEWLNDLIEELENRREALVEAESTDE